MIEGYSTLRDIVIPAVKGAGRTVRDISLVTALALAATSGISYAGNSLGFGSSYRQEQSAQRKETLQKKVELRWEVSVKDGSWKEKLSGITSYKSYFNISSQEDMEKQPNLPDEVKIEDRVIDIVDSSEEGKYKRKEVVDYNFKVYVDDGAIAPAGMQFGTKKVYKTAEEFKKVSKNMLENMAWMFALSEVEKEKADGFSVAHSAGFPQYNILSAEGMGYSGLGMTFPRVTFYFKEG